MALGLFLPANRAGALTPTNYVNFTASSGGTPPTGLVLSGNTLYGVTFNGGGGSVGTVFKILTNGAGYQNFFEFCRRQRRGQSLVGRRAGGFQRHAVWDDAKRLRTNGQGMVFRMSTGWNRLYQPLQFHRDKRPGLPNSDGAKPNGGLVLSGNTL